MVEWWTKSEKAMVDEKINRQKFASILKDSHHLMQLRNDCDLFFEELEKLNIPYEHIDNQILT
jgi:hypothetical protein